MDIWTTDTHEFAWNPEGTLARWTDPNADYERVFSYDEEGRLTKIERDNGPSVQTAYEYTYTGDGIRHIKKDHLTTKEYRYGCSIDCGGTPLRVYSRELGSQGEWSNVEDYLQMLYGTLYQNSLGSFSDYRLPSGHWLSDMGSTEVGYFVCRDSFGVTPVLVEMDIPAPLYLGQDEGTIPGEYAPAALKVVVIVGLVLIGISACALCASKLVEGVSGSDAFLHCYGGCMGCSTCGCPLGLLGVGKELGDFLHGGTVELRDVINTEAGCLVGKAVCQRAPLFLGLRKKCCEKACLLAERWGVLR